MKHQNQHHGQPVDVVHLGLLAALGAVAAARGVGEGVDAGEGAARGRRRRASAEHEELRWEADSTVVASRPRWP